jgi:hypothetical protein
MFKFGIIRGYMMNLAIPILLYVQVEFNKI